MSWPLSHEFNEAVQNPRAVFADPDLKSAEAVVGATGLPLPRSGNFADVYQLRAADGREWAVKCFTRPVAGLGERYARVGAALAKASLPFTIGFEFLAEGIRVGGAWRPVVKMEWVEGLLLNQVARESAGKPAVLTALGVIWARLCKRLREAGVAHADLQHGNALLVPGSRPGAFAVRLIDYDGMWVPALANTPSGESGHSSYQHPARAATRAYSPDVDRFPHLVIATALRGLAAGGPALWEKYDNGDNLLFTEADFKKPSESKLMRELWQAGEPALQSLVGRIAVAGTRPLPQTPWLDQVAPEGEPVPLDDATRREAAAALGIALPVPVPLPPEPSRAPAAPLPQPVLPVPVAPLPVPAAAPAAVLVPLPAVAGEEDAVNVELVEPPLIDRAGPRSAARRRKAERAKEGDSKTLVFLLIGAGLLLLLGGGVIAGVLLGNKSKPETVQKEEPKEPVRPPEKKEKGPEREPEKPKEKAPDPPVTPPGGIAGKRPADPQPTDPPALKERWSAPLETQSVPRHLVSEGGNLVLAASLTTGKGGAFNLSDGNPRPDFAPLTRVRDLFALDGGRFAVRSVAGSELTVRDEQTGREIERIRIPAIPPAGVPVAVPSPNGKYLAVYYPSLPNAPAPEQPCHVFEVVGDKPLFAPDWKGGSVHFTADSSRVLLAERSGRCRWFQLPSGKEGVRWELTGDTSNGRYHTVTGISADGAVLGYNGPLERPRNFAGPSVLDGATGKVVHTFPTGQEYDSRSQVAVSADGRRVAVQRTLAPGDARIDVADARTGAVLGRATVDFGMPRCELTRDGSALVVFSSQGKRLHVFDVPGPPGLPPPPSPTPKPPEPKVATLPDLPPLKEKWAVECKAELADAAPRFDDNGQTVALVATSGPVAASAFNARNRGAFVRNLTTKSGQFRRAFGLDRGKFAFQTDSDRNLVVWDPATGKLSSKSFQRPAGPAGTPYVDLSPDERYLAVGAARPATTPKDRPPSRLSVFDRATNKAVVTLDWQPGRTAFADRRLLAVDDTDTFRWYRLGAKAGGRPEAEWSFGRTPDGQNARLLGVSAKGEAILYCGRPTGRAEGFHLLDGRDGSVRQSFPARFYSDAGGSLSADGRYVLLVRNDGGKEHSAEVIEAGGRRVGSVKLPEGGAAVLAVSWKAGIAVTYDRETRRLAAYELPVSP